MANRVYIPDNWFLCSEFVFVKKLLEYWQWQIIMIDNNEKLMRTEFFDSYD